MTCWPTLTRTDLTTPDQSARSCCCIFIASRTQIYVPCYHLVARLDLDRQDIPGIGAENTLLGSGGLSTTAPTGLSDVAGGRAVRTTAESRRAEGAGLRTFWVAELPYQVADIHVDLVAIHDRPNRAFGQVIHLNRVPLPLDLHSDRFSHAWITSGRQEI